MKSLRGICAGLLLCAAAGAGRDYTALTTAEGFLAGAYELLGEGEPEKAIAYLQYALWYQPLDRELNLLYLEVLREEGLEIVAAAAHVERLESYPDEPIVLFAAGRLAEEEGKRRRYFEEAREAGPEFAPAYLGLAEVAGGRGDFEKARAEVERALEVKGDYRAAYAFRGKLHLAAGELDPAEDDLKRAREGDPYAPGAHADLAQVYLLRGDAAAAREEYRRALAQSDDRGEYYFGLAKAHETLGEPEAARSAYEAAADPTHAADIMFAARARKEAGRLAFAARDYVEAAEHIGWAVLFLEGDAELHAYLGGLYLRIDRPREAAAKFELASRLDSENGVYLHLLGASRARAGDLGAAAEALERAIELLPEGEAAEVKGELAEVRERIKAGEKKPEE